MEYEVGGEYRIVSLGRTDQFVRQGAESLVTGLRCTFVRMCNAGSIYLQLLNPPTELTEAEVYKRNTSLDGTSCFIYPGIVLSPVQQDTPELLAYDLIDQE